MTGPFSSTGHLLLAVQAPGQGTLYGHYATFPSICAELSSRPGPQLYVAYVTFS